MPTNSSGVNNLAPWRQAAKTGLLSSDPGERRSRYAELAFINKDRVDRSALEQCSKKAHSCHESITCCGYLYANHRDMAKVIDVMVSHYAFEASLPCSLLSNDFYNQAFAAIDVALDIHAAQNGANLREDSDIWRIMSEAVILLWIATRNEL